MSTVGRVLVVSATRAEAAHVPPGMELVVTGIGKTAAAVATARALAARADLIGLTVVNVGTAGALRPGLQGLHEVGIVVNHDISAELIRSLGHDPRERIVLGPAETVLATGDVFVTDPAVRDHLASRAHLVDMEGYAVAYAAEQFGVPCRLVKHVSDNADAGAMDWPALVDRSARALGEWLSASC